MLETQDALTDYAVERFGNGMPGSHRAEQVIDGLKFTLVYNPKANSLRIENPDDGVQWMYAFWFAWAAFHPKTELVSPPALP